MDLADLENTLLGDIVDDTIHDAPTNKVQLGDSCRQTHKLDPLSSTKWIKKLFGIAVQGRLVRHVHSKLTTGRRLVCDVRLTGIVCHKPLKVSERHTTSMFKNVL